MVDGTDYVRSLVIGNEIKDESEDIFDEVNSMRQSIVRPLLEVG